jgi:hypothetical protein
MKKIISVLFLMGIGIATQAQETESDTTSYWKSEGIFSVLVNQSSFNNWIVGGENNLSGNLGVNYKLGYAKDDWTWDNRILASYGLVKTQTSSFEKKTDDRFEINSVLGKKASGRWSYSAFINFRTQFTKGFTYGKDADGAEFRIENTNFLSPGYLTFGPGMLYKKDNNFYINIAPATSKITIVDKAFTSGADYIEGSYFGVDANKSLRYEFGFSTSFYYKLSIMANVSAENSLNLYSNYLEETKNVDVDYSLNIVMKINRYLSTNLSIQAIYDDNAFEGLQTRQVFGVGVNFNF